MPRVVAGDRIHRDRRNFYNQVIAAPTDAPPSDEWAPNRNLERGMPSRHYKRELIRHKSGDRLRHYTPKDITFFEDGHVEVLRQTGRLKDMSHALELHDRWNDMMHRQQDPDTMWPYNVRHTPAPRIRWLL